MPNDLTVRRNWLVRALAWLRVVTVSQADSHDYGDGFGSGVATPPGYSHLRAMSALGAFGWIRAMADIVSADIAALPLSVTRGRGDAREPVPDHPFLELMEQPSQKMNGNLFRRQLAIDYLLTGNAYILMLPIGGERGRVDMLLRLHPHRIKPLVGPDGQIDAYEFDQRGSTIRYSWEDVLHVRGPSWQDDATLAMGEGWIRSLDKALTALEAADEADRKAAKTGRPAVAVAPGNDKDSWTEKQVNAVTGMLERAFSNTHGGIFVNGKQLSIEQLGWSAQDMERPSHRAWIREELMATAKVPPTKLGLKIANYATAAQEKKVHWEARMGEAALFDAEFTRLARRMSGDLTEQVSHQFSHLDAFQLDRSERLRRVQDHKRLGGMTLTEAYAYEGFEDAPVEEKEVADVQTSLNGAQVVAAAQIIAEVAAGNLPRESGVQMLISFFGITEESAEAIMGEVGRGFTPAIVEEPAKVVPFERWWGRQQPPKTEEARASLWRSIEAVRVEREQKLERAVMKALRAQLKRLAARMRQQLKRTATGEVKALSDADLVAILRSTEEAGLVTEYLRPEVMRIFAEAVAETAQRMGLSLDDALAELVKQAEEIAAETALLMQSTTDAVVRDIIETGLGEGSEVGEMVRRLGQSRAFRDTRGQMVSRTATTRTLNEASVAAMAEAEKEGITVKKQWLSTRDGYTRDTHSSMDGQTVPTDEPFKSPNGGEAMHPGGFGIAAEDINCRCTVLPIVED